MSVIDLMRQIKKDKLAVRECDGIFVLTTNNTTYMFRVMDTGHLEHLYYGSKLYFGEAQNNNALKAAVQAMSVKRANANSGIVYDKEHPAINMNDVNLEVSGRGTGDMRSPFVELEWADGTCTVDMIYDSFELINEKLPLKTLPSSYDESTDAKTLKIILKEKYQPVKLELYYSVFPSCDVIVRSCILKNEGTQSVKIKRLMSAQLDLPGTNYVMTSFHGDWANEMGRYDTPVNAARIVNTTQTGFSSSHSNPFVMLFAKGSSEDFGEGYACNLIYSGSHMECAEVGSQRQTRFLAGISPEQFSWILGSGEAFEAPEAVLTFSENGYRKISINMHKFVREHIVRGEWKKKERPVLLNSWEAAYFAFNERKLLQLAKAGSEVGVELFVLDDGWFGERNDDKRSLGDWEVNKKKLPCGIEGLAEKVNAMGMMFGIWVEPEMVNADSDLYTSHPDWAVKIPERSHSEGRNQMLLDLTREEVQDYLIDAMSNVFASGKISYVKWDMNRNFSDLYSQSLAPAQQGEFLHRYIMGLYRITGTLVKRFPHILFEGCASGGNRFDLGILCYMPQIWASDNSDAISRCYIQNGLSYGYPQSVIGAHVSSCPNHQTLRNTPLETRFAVASMGVLGYECNMADMNKEELDIIKEQIKVYKQWRNILQFGQFYRIGGKLAGDMGRGGTPDSTNLVEWNIVSEDREHAVVVMVQDMVKPNTSQLTLRTKGLANHMVYHFVGKEVSHDIRRFGDLVNMIAPVHIKKDSFLHCAIAKFVKMDGEIEDYTVSGSVMNQAGIALSQGFAGTGYNKGTRLYQDFDAKMYFVEKE